MAVRERVSTKQSVLDVLSEFKGDLEIDPASFDTIWKDDGEALPIKEIFNRAGMNPAKVSHWQAIVVACASCLFTEDEDFSPRGRPKDWTEEAKGRLIDWWFEAKLAYPNEGVGRLFARMITKYGSFQLTQERGINDPEVLRLQFQQVLNSARTAAQSGNENDQQKRLIDNFPKLSKRLS